MQDKTINIWVLKFGASSIIVFTVPTMQAIITSPSKTMKYSRPDSIFLHDLSMFSPEDEDFISMKQVDAYIELDNHWSWYGPRHQLNQLFSRVST